MPSPMTGAAREKWANQLAQGSMSTYEPSFRDQITGAVRDYWPWESTKEQKAQDIGNILDWTPGIGEAFDTDTVKRDLEAGNLGDAALTAGLMVLPGSASKAKDLVKKGAKKVKQLATSAVEDVAAPAAEALATPAIRSKTADALGTPNEHGIIDPVREAYPGIYKDPKQLAQEAEAQVAEEHPAMKELFGVSRGDLAEIGEHGRRKGNMEPKIAGAKNPKGSYAADQIMTPRNAERLADALEASKKHAPRLTEGMDAWYVMDPAYQRLEEIAGPEEAKRLYSRLNTVTGMHSPGSEVLTEINRGTAANMLLEQGRFDDWKKYGGMAEGNRGADFPAELRDVIGHPYHSTAHTGPMSKYLEKGEVDMTQPKVPLYIQASGVPQTGFQTKLPVPDAHFTRAVGMSDVRKNANPGASMKTPEYAPVGPWFRENVAKPAGIEAVPAQARTWGLFSPQTGVDTPIGAPKLELLSQRIWERAKKLGIPPDVVRDAVLKGKEHAVWPLLFGGAAAGQLAGQDEGGR